MASYWGCGTPINRAAWATAIFLVLLGTGLTVVGGAGGASTFVTTSSTGSLNCWQLYEHCLQEPGEPSTSYCADVCDVLCQFRQWQGLLITGIVLCVVGLVAPVSYFCFFSGRPDDYSSCRASAEKLESNLVLDMKLYMKHLPQPQADVPITAHPTSVKDVV